VGQIRWNLLAAAVIAAGAVFAALTIQPGGDYFFDSGAIDALVRGDLEDFFAEQPLMGPLSLLLRAPFVALVFDADLTTVYFAGVVPCLAALLALAGLLWRRAGGDLPRRLAVVLVCAGSAITVRALHWGHPEELLAAALCVGGMLAAIGGRPVLAGVLLGCAFATKQWALVAAAPMLAALPAGHWRFVLVSAGTGAAFTLPMLLGDPQRFWLIVEAAGSPDPSTVLGLRNGPFPDGRVAPHSLLFPFSSPELVDGRRYFFMSGWVTQLTHPVILLLPLPLSLWLWRRRSRHVDGLDALRLLSLVLLARCALDPNDLDYYHVPLLASLAALAAHGGPGELRGALLGAAGLTLAFAQPADSVAAISEHAWLQFAAYAATTLGLAAWLLRGMLAVPAREPALAVVHARASAGAARAV
jgi:hypothetical protein